MNAAFETCRKRTVLVLASGVVISLTALTGGVAPAFADPDTDPVAPTTTILPEPEVVPTQEVAEQPTEQPTVADVPSVAPSILPAPAEAPIQTRAPVATPTPVAPTTATATLPTSTVEPPSATRATPAPSTRAPAATTATQNPTVQRPTQTTPIPTPRAQIPTPTAAIPTPTAAIATPTAAIPTPDGSIPTPDGSIPTPDGSTPASPALVPPASDASQTPESDTSTPESDSSPSPTVDDSSTAAPEAEQVIEQVEPQTLEAPAEDVQLARSARVIEEKPVVAAQEQVEEIANLIDLPILDRDRDDQNRFRDDDDDRVRFAGDRRWDRNVRQWRPEWVEYDEFYRPVLSNPFRDPVRIIYIVDNRPQIAFIPPLARIVLEVAQFAAYSFTAVVQTANALVSTAVNTAVNVAVGSFFGGGFIPQFGQQQFVPPPLSLFNNVPVQVRYPDAVYEPFRVARIVDVGDDARVGGRKVLLDGVTPAWGRWTQTLSGERSFEVFKTQQFPGLDEPRAGPLPGDYQLRLASDESASREGRRDAYLIAVATVCGVLSIGAVLASIVIGRRRRLTP